MNIAEYWNEKTALSEKAFEGWQRKEEVQIRKLIISKLMNISMERLSYYIKRDEWYRKFVLEDAAEVDRGFAEEEDVKEKVQAVIEELFYIRDYEALCEIKKRTVIKNEPRKKKRKSEEKEPSAKEKVCDWIKVLVEDEVYKELSKPDKLLVDTLEKIYFDPIELFNEYVEESSGSETYYTILVEQWKCANEMAANISAQRNNMNNFYMSLMSVLLGGVLFSNQVLDVSIWARTVLYVAVLIIGTVCCGKWISQIENYGRLNNEKYNVINELERRLPANVLLYEWLHTEKNARRTKVKVNFSDQEKSIAKLFRMVVILVSVFLLIIAWGGYLWTKIAK